ncbi:MAG: helix-turn-helix transcriptional regulator [Clostridia bacterium]|nr:helix-turn-helix transcriptional regulator [Clostridia bacterium]
MDAKKTGQLICESRKQHGMSQKDLADILNITDKAVSKWERGISFPDISLLIPLSETLGISLYDLLSGGDHDGQK